MPMPLSRSERRTAPKTKVVNAPPKCCDVVSTVGWRRYCVLVAAAGEVPIMREVETDEEAAAVCCSDKSLVLLLLLLSPARANDLNCAR